MLGAVHATTLYTAATLGVALAQLGRHTEAKTLLPDTHARCTRTLGVKHPNALRASSVLGQALRAGGETAATVEGTALLRATHVAQTELLGASHAETRRTAARLAACDF